MNFNQSPMHLLLKWVPQKMHRWQVDDAQAPDTLVTFVWLWIGQIQNTKKKKKKVRAKLAPRKTHTHTHIENYSELPFCIN